MLCWFGVVSETIYDRSRFVTQSWLVYSTEKLEFRKEFSLNLLDPEAKHSQENDVPPNQHREETPFPFLYLPDTGDTRDGKEEILFREANLKHARGDRSRSVSDLLDLQGSIRRQPSERNSVFKLSFALQATGVHYRNAKEVEIVRLRLNTIHVIIMTQWNYVKFDVSQKELREIVKRS